MLALKNSAASRSSKNRGTYWSLAAAAAVLILLCAISFAAAWFHSSRGYTLYYGDAEAHLNIARRIVDSRTPGYEQIGTVWLPLPHALMLPLVRDDERWRSGLAGTAPSTFCFVLAGLFLFAAVRRIFDSTVAGFAAALVFALNANLLYLQSTAMTEPVFFAALMALLYCIVRYSEQPTVLWALAAAIASNAASLTRYEGWFLIPFAFLLLLRKPWLAFLFGAVAALGPLAWLAHNWWYFGDPLEFYRGEWSAQAIYQRSLAGGMTAYPGDHDWAKAWLYFRTAAAWCLGKPLLWIGAAGVAAALYRRMWRPALLLALPGSFYIWSLYSSGTPIFVPDLWPHSYYNLRYGLAVLPLAALGSGALVSFAPRLLRGAAGLVIVGAAAAPWILSPQPESWVCWKESQVNSETRRTWTRQAADFLRERYRPGDGIIYSFGDLTGVLREAGIPLREGLHEGNRPMWPAAVARPELFLREEWALTYSGDRVASALLRARRAGLRYTLVYSISPRGGPVIEIYRRGDL